VKRIVMWQIPLGNTKMRAQNNTTGHDQDNRPEWLLDDPLRTRGTTPTLVTPYAADDDGGFFRWKAWEYYQGGAMPLAPASGPAAPTNFRITP